MERILIYRLGSMGDAVMALPAFHFIRKSYPKAHITVLTNFSIQKKAAPLTSILPQNLYDAVIQYPLNLRGISEIQKLVSEIRKKRFDLLISLAAPRGLIKSVRDYLFFQTCGIHSIRGIPFQKKHLQCQPIQNHYEWEAQRIANRLNWLGKFDLNHHQYWDFNFTREEQAEIELIAQKHLLKHPVIALNAGGKSAVNDWTNTHWIPLIKMLSQNFSDFTLLGIGALDERERCKVLLQNWNGRTVNLCGETSPRITAGILKNAGLFIGHDSGPIHLAGAVGTPCVGIYSARNLPRQWFPRGDHNLIFYNQTECFGCCLEECHTHGKKCILSTKPETVFARILSSNLLHPFSRENNQNAIYGTNILSAPAI